MDSDRITSTNSTDEERRLELTVRPQFFDDYIGQSKVRDNLTVFITAAKRLIIR